MQHLTNIETIFDTFEKGGVNVIKCANSDSNADIKAQGKGIVKLKTNTKQKQKFKLKNVIYSDLLSENLLSIRHFAEAGFDIKLNCDEVIIYNPMTNEIFAKGEYKSPYWIIEFQLDKDNSLRAEAFETQVSNENLDSNQNSDQMTVTKDGINETNNVKSSETCDNSDKNGNQIIQDLLHEILINKKQSDKFGNKTVINETVDNETVTSRKITNLHEIPEIDLLNDDNFLIDVNSKLKYINKAMLWHMRMGHASLDYLRNLQKIWVDNKELQTVNFNDNDSIIDCEVCLIAKMKRLPFKSERTRASRPLQVIHSDVMGKISPATYPHGYQYVVVFVDDYSRFALAYPMKTKDETGYCLEQFIRSARNLLGTNEKICFLRTDQGSEYTGGYTQEVMKREGFEHQMACPDTPQHNGVSERFNQTIQKKVRSMMFDSRLPLNMWDLALNAAVYVYNRTPHKSNNFETPLSKFAPDFHYSIDQIKRFGCLAYWRVTRKPESKFSARGIRGVLVGYTLSGYIFLNPESGNFFQSRDMRFNEKLVYGDKFRRNSIQHWPVSNDGLNIKDWFQNLDNEQKEQIEESNDEEVKPKQKRGRPPKRTLETEGENDGERKKITKVSREPYNTRSKGLKDTSFEGLANLATVTTGFEFPQLHNELEAVNENPMTDEILYSFFAKLNNDPTTYEEAMRSENKKEWQKAIDSELESMHTNKVWMEVDKPNIENGKRPNILDSKWVFKRKVQNDGKIKYKARLVIRGFKDKNVYNLKETYAPVSRLTLVRAVLAIINSFFFYNLEVVQLDVKTAFLNGTIEGVIYMRIPDGIKVSEEIKYTKVYRLLKALYGLKISPKRWYKKFKTVMTALGFVCDWNDPCLFIYKSGDIMVILLLYVDDMLLASNDGTKLQEVREKLMKEFEMTDLGEPKVFLGMNIRRNQETKTMKIDQADYTNKIIEKFGFSEVYYKNTPMITRQVSNRERKEREDKTEDSTNMTVPTIDAPYREIVGSLLYLAGSTRPDIAYTVNILSRHQMNPTENEWNMIRRIFQYLKGTVTMGLTFLGRTNEMVAFSDSSFADCKGSVSTCGYIVRLFGDTIAWKTTKQKYVALSTCEAEYVAMSEASREIVSIDKSISKIINKSLFPVVLYCDNRAAIFCASTNRSNKLRHMTEVHQDYIKECVDCERIIIKWVSTKDQLADIMTKPLAYEIHSKIRDKIINIERF